MPSQYVKAMLSTLHESTGVVPGKTWDDVDLDTEAKKWREEFNESNAELLEELVRAAIPDYEYLKTKGLRA
jgi:predicted transcriptional regulator